MKKWTDDFLSKCLDGLPKDKYRRRVQAELEDHLLSLTQDFEDTGEAPENAQARALELMGDPAELNSSFREEWVRRASRWGYCLPKLLLGAFHALAVNTLIRWFLLIPIIFITRAQLLDWRDANELLYAFLSAVLYSLPGLWFILRELNEIFLLLPRRRLLVILGLLLAWGLETLSIAVPVLLNALGLPALGFYIAFIFCIFAGLSDIFLMALGSVPAYLCYALTALALCLLFGLLYRPRRVPGGDPR